jgi:hypothetical protein
MLRAGRIRARILPPTRTETTRRKDRVRDSEC